VRVAAALGAGVNVGGTGSGVGTLRALGASGVLGALRALGAVATAGFAGVAADLARPLAADLVRPLAAGGRTPIRPLVVRRPRRRRQPRRLAGLDGRTAGGRGVLGGVIREVGEVGPLRAPAR